MQYTYKQTSGNDLLSRDKVCQYRPLFFHSKISNQMLFNLGTKTTCQKGQFCYVPSMRGLCWDWLNACVHTGKVKFDKNRE